MKYGVSIAVIFTTEVEADSPEEAVDLAVNEAAEETGECWDLE